MTRKSDRSQIRIRLQNSVLELFLSLLSIDSRTGNPTGSIHALTKVRAFLTQNGIAETDILNHKEAPLLIATVRGTNEDRRLILFSHIDTADWHDRDWLYEPLGKTESNGKIYGVGAVDCKSLCAIQAGLAASISQGIQPSCSIILIITSDEEHGGSEGMGRLMQTGRIPTENTFAIGEGGGYILPERNGYSITCQIGEKGRWKFPLPHTGFTSETIINEVSLPVCKNSRHAMISPTGNQVTFHIRDGEGVLSFPPGTNMRRIRRRLHSRKLLDRNISGNLEAAADQSSCSTELFRAIRTLSRISGYERVIPTITPGYSDARFLRQAGIPTYGFFPVGKRELISSMHGTDEHIHKDSFFEAFEMLGSVIGYIL